MVWQVSHVRGGQHNGRVLKKSRWTDGLLYVAQDLRETQARGPLVSGPQSGFSGSQAQSQKWAAAASVRAQRPGLLLTFYYVDDIVYPGL